MPDSSREQIVKGDSEETMMLLDADIHQRWADDETIVQYLPERYQDDGIVAPELLYRNPGGFLKQDQTPENGNKPGSDLEKIIKDHVEQYDIDYAMFTGNS